MLGLLPRRTQAQTKEPSIEGSWRITFYIEPFHSLGSTQCVVFTVTGGEVGEPLSGTWTSPTVPGWVGRWFQEGEHVQWYGFTSGAALATSEYGDLANNSLSQGKFNHFLPPDGRTSSGGAWRGSRVNTCTTAAVPPSGQDPAARAQ